MAAIRSAGAIAPGLLRARMLLEIVDSPASDPNDDDRPALKPERARVELRDVTFGYRPDQPVLRRMSYIAPGKDDSACRASGGGDSTVLSLLLRFYEVDQGAVVIDQQIISDCSRASPT